MSHMKRMSWSEKGEKINGQYTSFWNVIFQYSNRENIELTKIFFRIWKIFEIREMLSKTKSQNHRCHLTGF